ncbi:RNA polymerase sigma-70 factor, ECF subfamily [Bacteroidales bacterium WCE2008]|nr:RNA polymerase sigma-70 factor, ECF subfamily [Bacteroidales bacterium WCE2008]
MNLRQENRLAEETILTLVRRGDTNAMQIFYNQYAGYLTAVCSRYVVDTDQVKDILQEAFIKIFDSLDKFEFRGEGSVKAWVRRIVVNDSIRYLKHNCKVSLVYDIPDTPDEDEDPPYGDVPASVIQQMIKELPDGYRTVFNLYVFEDKSHKEIASLLGIKEDSSASQLFRAKKILATRIKEYLNRNRDE